MVLLRSCFSNFFIFSYRHCSSSTTTKSISVAIIGSPNAGKSTLINQIVGAKVSAVSDIAHTTRSYANGILTVNDTQLVFTDTPGTVSYQQGRRLNMTNFHIKAPHRVASSVDVLAVVSNIASKKTRDYIDETILEILYENSSIPSILIMNKVDLLKRKEDLLYLASLLTTDRKKDQWGYLNHGGYSNFEKVFMVSAKTGDGTDDILSYFISKAKSGIWYYSEEVYSDSSIQKQVSEVFREVLLSLFAQEIPWQVKQELVLFHEHENVIRIHHKLTWPRKSQQRYVSTKRDEIMAICTKELENMFQSPVELTIDISQKDKMNREDLIVY